MGFARKDLNEVLDSLGVEIPDDARENAVTKIMSLHGTSISGMKNRLERYDSMDVETLKQDSETLKGIRTKLGDTSLDAVLAEHKMVTEQLGGRKLEDVIKQNGEYAAAAEANTREKAVDTLLKDCKFANKYAEDFVRSQFSSLELTKDGTLKGGDDVLKGLLETNKDAFTQTQPLPQFSSTGAAPQMNNSMSDQDAFLAARYGMKN